MNDNLLTPEEKNKIINAVAKHFNVEPETNLWDLLIETSVQAYANKLSVTDAELVEKLAELFCLDCFEHQKNHSCEHTNSDSHDCYGYLATDVLKNLSPIISQRIHDAEKRGAREERERIKLKLDCVFGVGFNCRGNYHAESLDCHNCSDKKPCEIKQALTKEASNEK